MFGRFGRRKGRKYPVKLDHEGKSARQRCFEMLANHMPSEEIARATGVPVETVYRYRQQWKKHPNLETNVAYLKELLKNDSPDREKTIELLAKVCQIPKEELEAIIHQPNGAKRIILQKFYFPGHREADHKRYVSFELAVFMSEFLIKKGGTFEDVHCYLREVHRRNKERSDREEEDVRRENQAVALMRAIIQADLEKERQARVQPDRLTPDQIRALMRIRRKESEKRAEARYWMWITDLVDQGLTVAQAREKLYQDLLRWGYPKFAADFRSWQDRIHPLRPDRESPPLAPPSSDTGTD